MKNTVLAASLVLAFASGAQAAIDASTFVGASTPLQTADRKSVV